MVYSLMGHDVQVQNIVFLSQGTYLITRLVVNMLIYFLIKNLFEHILFFSNLDEFESSFGDYFVPRALKWIRIVNNTHPDGCRPASLETISIHNC